MAIPLNPIDLVKEMVNANGQDITYAYEDLVFVSHDHYLLRFLDTGEELALHVNSQCPPSEATGLESALMELGAARGITVTRHEDYTISSNEEDQTISLEFTPPH